MEWPGNEATVQWCSLIPMHGNKATVQWCSLIPMHGNEATVQWCSLIPRPSTLQAIKNWRCGRPGNEAKVCVCVLLKPRSQAYPVPFVLRFALTMMQKR